MTTKIVKLLTAFALFIGSFSAFAQPTFVIQNIRGACGGFNNGSFELLVTSATGPVSVFVLGPPNTGPIGVTVGVPFLVSNLPGGTAPVGNYLVVVQDVATSTTNVQIPNYPITL